MAAILLYHAVADEVVDDALQVRAATINRHLEWCRDLGYEVAPLDDVLANSSEKLMAITFDDDLASIGEVLPRLVAPTVFICPGMLGRENVWRSRGRASERLFTEAEVFRLQSQGVRLGCHGWDHRAFVDRTRDDMTADLAACRAWFGTNPPSTFAWPFGRFDHAAVELIEPEYRFALAVEPTWGEDVTRSKIARVFATEPMTAESFADAVELADFRLEPDPI